MNRRRFLCTSAGLPLVLGRGARAAAADAGFDRHGGWRGLKLDATGFFRVERRERWWFVTPEGHAWLGFGLNHVHPGWLHQAYNGELWRRRFGAEKFNDAAWKTGVRDLVRRQMGECGYNHIGVHNDLAAVAGLGFPEIRSVQFVRIAHPAVATAADFPDVFAPGFERHCEALAERECAPHRDNPLVLGWAFTDCPILTEAEAAARPVVTHGSSRGACPTWPRVLRNLPGAAPGKQAWVATLRARYADDVRAFNDCYGTHFGSWGELLDAPHWRDLTDLGNARELADNHAFLEKIVDRYYTVACAAVRRHAPRHLVFGDKLNGNTDGADAVVAVTARHTDVVFYQMYERWAHQRAALERWSSRADRPAFNGDGTFSCPDDNMPNPHGPHARDQAERGEWAFEFGRGAFARPDFVGWTVCGWVDTWRSMPRKEEKQHSGFFTPSGEPHAAYVRRLREMSERLYDFARGGRGAG